VAIKRLKGFNPIRMVPQKAGFVR